MLAHWVPRQWWPDKPQRSTGLLPQARQHFATPIETNLGTGGATGAVADLFDNYWHFAVVVWFLVGWGAARLYQRAHAGDDLRWKLHYVGLLMSMHWAIAQCFSEALVPCLFFQAAFWVSCVWSRNSVVGARSFPMIGSPAAAPLGGGAP